MNTHRLESILDRYDPENDIGPITYADAALLEMVIDLVERVQELEAMLKPAPALVQPSMFPAGEDAPLFTMADDAPRIELVYGALSVTTRDLCLQVLAVSRTPADCWQRLESMRNNGDIPQTQYDEIKRMADFIEAD